MDSQACVHGTLLLVIRLPHVRVEGVVVWSHPHTVTLHLRVEGVQDRQSVHMPVMVAWEEHVQDSPRELSSHPLADSQT